MAELDVFERRLRAALLRHVADGPTEFDALGFARAVAVKEPRRHGMAATLRWRDLTIPRLAWILLLLGALLAAMVAAMLIVGSQRPAIGFVCPPGSTPNTPGRFDQARPQTDASVPVAFDRGAGRLVALAGGANGRETWTFDVCTNAWTRMYPSREPPSSDWGLLVYDADSRVTIATLWSDQSTAADFDPQTGTWTPATFVPTQEVWAYDIQANTWTVMGAAPSGLRTWAYDPQSGLVVAASATDATQLWTYDVETDRWTPIPSASPASDPGPVGLLAYDASVDLMVVYTTEGTWLVDIRTGAWSRSAADTPTVNAGWGMSPPAIVYDEAVERTMVIGWDVAAYDATADQWVVKATPDLSVSVPYLMAYDAVNRRLIGVVPPGYADGVIGDHGSVVAFDSVTREWTVLLDAGEGRPADTAPPVSPVVDCPPGSTPDEPGPVDQARPGFSDLDVVAFDRRAGRLVAVTTAGSRTGNRVETWTFDVCRNTWAQMNPNREPPNFLWARLVYDVDSGVTIGTFGRSQLQTAGQPTTEVWVYDLQANTWTQMGAPPGDGAGALAYDPPSGLVVAPGATEIWSYEVETDRWSLIRQWSWDHNGPFAYDAAVDRVVVYARDPTMPETWLLDIRTGTWSRSLAETPIFPGWIWPATPTLVYDEAARRTVAVSGSRIATYDATADRWDIVAGGGTSGWISGSVAYDPVNRRLIGLRQPGSDADGTTVDGGGVVAFDMRTHEWTTLLEPGPGQATP